MLKEIKTLHIQKTLALPDFKVEPEWAYAEVREQLIRELSEKLFETEMKQMYTKYTVEYSMSVVVATPEEFAKMVETRAFELSRRLSNNF
jgi:hypothetical protein